MCQSFPLLYYTIIYHFHKTYNFFEISNEIRFDIMIYFNFNSKSNGSDLGVVVSVFDCYTSQFGVNSHQNKNIIWHLYGSILSQDYNDHHVISLIELALNSRSHITVRHFMYMQKDHAYLI